MNSNKDFFQEACRYADCSSTATIEKYYRACMEVIIRRLYIYGEVNVPLAGKITTRLLEAGKQTQTQPDGSKKVYKVPERILPMFVPTPDFIDDINMAGVTKAYRKKVKNGMLTDRDYRRMLRADDMDRKPERITHVFDEQAEENMEKLLEEKIASKQKENNKQ